MLIYGLYNPPKHKYQEADLMNYLITFVDSVLDKHPDTIIVCGGDVNRLDTQELKALSRWDVMVDFPPRGNNCLTNRLDLFGNTYPLHMLIKTDYEGFVLPAGTKLKPTHRKVLVRDCREHLKQSFYLALPAQDWQEVDMPDNVDVAVRILEDKICSLMDKCMPLRSTRTSSRYSSWMSPLVRSMLRAKTRISLNNVDRLKLANSRISQVISESRRNPASVIGNQEWWKNVDLVSQRRAKTTCVNFDHALLDHLNDYFECLCHNDSYVRPTDLLTEGDGISRDNKEAGPEYSY